MICKPKVWTRTSLQTAAKHLSNVDQTLARLITEFGIPYDALMPKKINSIFAILAKTIVFQQLSGASARAIYNRVLTACDAADDRELSPQKMFDIGFDRLKEAGLSGRKIEYLKGLAKAYLDNKLRDEDLLCMKEESLLKVLSEIRGLGDWSINMLSIFHLGRPDVLPSGDLEVRKGVAKAYSLPSLPTPKQMEAVTDHWRPYRSLASYFMYRLT